MTRVAVVGSGAAGMLVALRLAPTCAVTLITKGVLGDGNTRWAQGGIAAATGPDDSAALHAADTVAAGAGLTDPAVAALLAAAGPARIAELIGLGLQFDRDEDRDGAQPARGLEAAHAIARVLHVGGDATGAGIAAVLVAAVRASGVVVREHTLAVDLLLRDGGVVGLETLDAHGPGLLAVDQVVLATGGAGQLFAHTTNPTGATADGVALAARAGAVLADLEFLQFHPTALAVPGSPLVSEAVRGEGAVLLDAHGHRFMVDLHPDAELAPRDVVARGIAAAMRRQGGRPVRLDATAIPELAARFPTIGATTRAGGFDWTREPIPVTPAAHYWMGGVATDIDGRTSVPGLWAIGEVACTGVHGANRLASNSLLEAFVFADRCARALPRAGAAWPFRPHAAPRSQWSTRTTPTRQSAVPVPQGNAPFSRAALQRLLWADAGLVRSAESLGRAAATIAAWRAAQPAPGSITGYSSTEWEDANLLLAGALLVDAALERRESRGAHFRSDFPRPDPAQAVRAFRRLTAPPAPLLAEIDAGARPSDSGARTAVR
ncbi:L-aspartate oxidase [uncultured Amnibacterium sp.]|uniref:L-aspartate oxidase n=1 Tax=uncultured Amnibacterium sp. TaxID=1631851 RepID=UPI0035CC0D4D